MSYPYLSQKIYSVPPVLSSAGGCSVFSDSAGGSGFSVSAGSGFSGSAAVSCSGSASGLVSFCSGFLEWFIEFYANFEKNREIEKYEILAQKY